MIIILNALVRNNRDLMLADHPFPGPSVLEFTVDLSRKLFPDIKIIPMTNYRKNKHRFMELGFEVSPISWDDTYTSWSWIDVQNAVAPYLDNSNEDVLLINMYEGPISGLRIKTIMDQMACENIVVSAYKRPSNSHPSYCHEYPHEIISKGYASFSTSDDTPKPYNPEKDLKLSNHDLFPSFRNIKGSQWLPKLFTVDAAIVWKGSQVDLNDIHDLKLWDIICADFKSEDIIWPYKLPVFTFNKNADFEI